jgi:hypothetical protein
MAADTTSLERLHLVEQNGLLIIPVDWQDAEALQAHLRKQEINTTVHLEPISKESRLEVWPGTDPRKVQQALDSWEGSAR